MNIPFVTRRWSRAPATLAAGPDSTVSIGFDLNVFMLVTPPSPRIIRSGDETPASDMAPSTKSATCRVFGRMLAFIAAVRVRISRPYVPDISCDDVHGMPAAADCSATNSSFEGSSTPNISVATMHRAPLSRMRDMASDTSSSVIRCDVSRNSWCVRSRLFAWPPPPMLLCESSRVLLMTSFFVGPTPMASIPTGYVSPSSSAFMAWVVLCATRSMSPSSMPALPMTLPKASSMPSDTPRSAVWVVGTVETDTMDPDSESIATAFVNVPPTSIPMRTRLRCRCCGCGGSGGCCC